MPEDGSSSSKLGSDLELDSVFVWLVSVSSSNLIDGPGLVSTIVAWMEEYPVIVSVSTGIDVKAVSGIVSDVSASAVVPSDLVVVSSLVWSHSHVVASSELRLNLVSESVVSSSPWSQGLSSGIEGPPLSSVTWVVVLDSDSVLVASTVLSPSGVEGWGSWKS